MIRNTDSELIKDISEINEIVWVEIGVYKGQNPQYVFNKFNIKKMYLIDPYVPLNYLPKYFGTKEIVDTNKNVAIKNLTNFNNKCVWLEDFSKNVYETFDDESIDIIYIDGNHSYESVLLDLNNYYDKVKNGGLIIGDDYNEEGVKKAVDEFTDKIGIKYNTITKYKNPPPTHKFWFKK